jgi:hypothetical protein
MALVRLTAVPRRKLQCGSKPLQAGQDDLLYCRVHDGGHRVALLQLGMNFGVFTFFEVKTSSRNDRCENATQSRLSLYLSRNYRC